MQFTITFRQLKTCIGTDHVGNTGKSSYTMDLDDYDYNSKAGFRPLLDYIFSDYLNVEALKQKLGPPGVNEVDFIFAELLKKMQTDSLFRMRIGQIAIDTLREHLQDKNLNELLTSSNLEERGLGALVAKVAGITVES